MNRQIVAKELLKIAKDLTAMEFDTQAEKDTYEKEHDVRPGTKLTVKKSEGSGDFHPSKMTEKLKKAWHKDDGSGKDFVLKYKDQIKKLYEDAIYERIKDEKNPEHIFLGSLDFSVDEKLGKKHFPDVTADGFISHVNKFLPHGDRIGVKSLVKRAFDRAFGKGVFEKVVAANKKRK